MAAKDGFVYRAGAIKRRPPEERWSPDWLRKIQGTPASPSTGTRDGSMSPMKIEVQLVRYRKQQRGELVEIKQDSLLMTLTKAELTRARSNEKEPMTIFAYKAS